MPSKAIFIIKAHGEKEPFSFQKVLQSAKRAGAPNDLAQSIAETIQTEVQPGMKTSAPVVILLKITFRLF